MGIWLKNAMSVAEAGLAYLLIIVGSMVAIEKGPAASSGVPVAGALILVARAIRRRT